MLEKYIFILSHSVQFSKFKKLYNKLILNQWKNYNEQKERQEKQLRNMIHYAYNNVPYYHRLFKNLKLFPKDIFTIEDLEKIPILTKDIIKNNWSDFIPKYLSKIKYTVNNTGGTTGTPFFYRISRYDRFLGAAILYRGWGYGGYNLADKMVFLAGSSLVNNSNSIISKKIHEFSRNILKLSSFDMSENDMNKYVKIINDNRPMYLRGYPSAIYFFSKWIEENDIKIHFPEAIFTTAEKLYPNMRDKIKEVFLCDVFDNYGLNDGGVSAYECKEHSGLHIDMERSVMELVDKDNNVITNGRGSILATSLHNYAMPFIRYHTGDEAVIIEDKCNCNRSFPLLKEIIGRSVDFFITPEGKYVHGWFFLYIFWEYGKGIKEYQVIQKDFENIEIKIVKTYNFDDKQLFMIEKIIMEKSNNWIINFKFVDKIKRTKSGKYKFIVNKINKNS